MLNYVQINSPSLNVRKAPSLSAARYNAPWPINRIALVSPSTPDWYKNLMKLNKAFCCNMTHEDIFKVANSCLGLYRRSGMDVVNYLLR